jgi:hypothetical protein
MFLSNSCFTDYEYNLPTGIHYFADYHTTGGVYHPFPL